MTTPDPWYAEGLCFSCTYCGNCCSGAPGYVWVAYQEIAALARALGLTTEQFETHHTRRVGSRQSLLEFDKGILFGDLLVEFFPVLQCREELK